MWASNWICAGLTALLVGFSVPASAQRAATGPADWPCVQRLIPQLSPGALWTGPAIDELEADWWSDAEMGSVVRFASTRATDENDAVERVRAFVSEIEEDREARLTLLFSGIFERISRERSSSIEAIRRYARGQVGQLERIGGLVDELEQARSAGERADIERLEQEIFWERRVFDNRQASLRALCEQPYLLEERLSRLVRVIQAQL